MVSISNKKFKIEIDVEVDPCEQDVGIIELGLKSQIQEMLTEGGLTDLTKATIERYEFSVKEVEMPLTPDEYVNEGGIKCPHCKTRTVISNTVDIGGTNGTVNCSCNNCGSEWVNNWGLTGYSDLKLPKK